VDAIMGQAWLERALPLLPAGVHVLVAPPLTYGKSNEHTGFPGTLSLSARTLRRLVIAAVDQLLGLGFRHIGLLNTHGGNSAVLVYTVRELQRRSGLRIGLVGHPYAPDVSEQERAYGFHAGEIETSWMLALAPEQVRLEQAVREYPARLDDPGELRPENAPAIYSWMTKDISRSGTMGDATAATAEKGERWLREGAAALARRLAALAPPA
jgi:creatinine amidohydrolase